MPIQGRLRLNGGIPAANGLLFVQTPSLSLALPAQHSDLGGAKLTLRARDGVVAPPWTGSRRVSVHHLVDGAEILSKLLGQSHEKGAQGPCTEFFCQSLEL